VAISFLIILSSGGIVSASQNSLPGDILHSIKTNIIEPVLGTLKFSPEAKAEYESDLAVERLVEAETLATEGKLDMVKEKEISTLLTSHTTALSKALAEIRQNAVSNGGKAEEIGSTFRAEMDAHADVLDIIKAQSSSTTEISDKQNQTTEDIYVSDTARARANNIKDSSQNKENKEKEEENKKEMYKTKKESIKEIIKSTDAELEQKSDAENKSSIRKIIINETRTTLEKAKQFLEESEKKDEEGDSENAYSSLLQSESSAKEANVFLKAGLGLKENKNEKSIENKKEEEKPKEENDWHLGE
jgi:hypothetical protein